MVNSTEPWIDRMVLTLMAHTTLPRLLAASPVATSAESWSPLSTLQWCRRSHDRPASIAAPGISQKTYAAVFRSCSPTQRGRFPSPSVDEVRVGAPMDRTKGVTMNPGRCWQVSCQVSVLNPSSRSRGVGGHHTVSGFVALPHRACTRTLRTATPNESVGPNWSDEE